MRTTDTSTSRVYVVDDDASVRHSLCWLLSTAGIESRAFDSAERLLGEWQPSWRGCITMDVRMPDMSGLQALAALGKLDNRLPVIIITGHADVPMAIKAMKLGAHDFIEKPYHDRTLIDCIRAAIEADLEQNAATVSRAEAAEKLAALTPREREVMQLVVSGQTNKEIAQALDISTKTVEIHRSRVMAKTESATLSDLIRLGLDAGVAE